MRARSSLVSSRYRTIRLDSDRSLAVALGVAAAIALAALFWPIALRRVFVYGDLGNGFLPLRLFLAENLARGITPLWMPNLFCGFYAHGEGQIGIFHPLRWLAYRFLPVSEAFNAECLLPYPFALAGAMLFLRRWSLPSSAALFGGIAFAFSPFLMLRVTHPNAVAVLAHLGWLLCAIDVALRESGPRQQLGWAGIAAVTGSQALVGYPASIAYCWMIALPYSLLVGIRDRRAWPALAIAVALGVGLVIGAIQLIPTFDYLATANRQRASYEFLTNLSLHPANLLTLVAPWLYRERLYMDALPNPIEQVFYLGPVVPISALWIVARARRDARVRPIAAALLALCAVALLLALGRHTPVYRYWLQIPLIGLLRVPARYDFALLGAGSAFAALAFADLLRDDRESRPIAAIWVVPALSWIVAAAALAQRARWEVLNGPGWILIGPIVFTLAGLLFTAAAHGRRNALLGLAVLALADHVAYAATLWWSEPPRTIAEYRTSVAEPLARPPARIWTPINLYMGPDDNGQLRYFATTKWIVRDARLVSGYIGLDPSKRLDYRIPASLRVAGATVQQMVDRVVPLSGALPRARMLVHAVPSALPSAEIARIDVATTALVEQPVAIEDGPPGEAEILEDLPGSVRIATRAATRQLLVLAESFHPGWQLMVDDGEPRPALRVNGDFLGAGVDAGEHRVEFRFAPHSFALGRTVSLAGVGLVSTVVLAAAIRLRSVRAG
jgi:hypothetical protein